jgi:hypothetical protein
MQMASGLGGYSSIGGAVSKMWREEGIRGFYKGLYPNLLKVRTPKKPLSPIALIPLSVQHFVCGGLIRVGRSEYGGKLVYI